MDSKKIRSFRLSTDDLWPEKLPSSFLNRVSDTIDFIKPEGGVADCGEDNPMKHYIESYFNITIDSLNWDFNHGQIRSVQYDTILCFEVLEHLMNPLLFLKEISDMLLPGGKIYLSTPYLWPQILKGGHHYHEIPTDRLMWLFEEAGLKVVRSGRVSIAGSLIYHLKGIRPLLRYFQYSRIYELCLEN